MDISEPELERLLDLFFCKGYRSGIDEKVKIIVKEKIVRVPYHKRYPWRPHPDINPFRRPIIHWR